MRVRRLAAIAVVLAAGGCGASAAASGAATPVLSCRQGGPGAERVTDSDVRLGPLAIVFARRTVGVPPNAFEGLGWKVPVTLRAGRKATLSVPRRLRGRVGLVFTFGAQRRVSRRGVTAADSKLTFEACAGDDAPVRTGWPGGIVVDHPRCARLRVRLPGAAEPIERRVPLGRRCR
jgi:hypothetical protein